MKFSKNNILLLNDFSTALGGAETVVENGAKILEENGFIVHRLNIKPSFWNIFLGGRFFHIGYFLQTLIALYKNDIGTIWTHNFSRNISASPLLAAKIMKRKIVLTVHDFHLYCPKTWGIYGDDQECEKGYGLRCFVRNCHSSYRPPISYFVHLFKWMKVCIHRQIVKYCVDIYFCPSQKVQLSLQESLGVPSEKFVYMPNYIENQEKIAISPETYGLQKKFYFIGRFSLEKGVLILLEAMNHLVNNLKIQDISLDIIGSGPEEGRLRKYVSEKKLEKNINFLGRKNPHEIEGLHQHYRAMIIPSIWLENNPLVALEAISHGKIILASRVGGLSEMINDGETGYLFRMGNYWDLANHIIKISQLAPHCLGQMSQNIIFTQNKFNKTIFIEKLLQNL